MGKSQSQHTYKMKYKDEQDNYIFSRKTHFETISSIIFAELSANGIPPPG